MKPTEQQQRAEYSAKLSGLSDDDLVKEAENYIWLSAYASNNPRSAYHWKADATYDEAKRREKPWLYQRGYNSAYRTVGYEPSESEIAAARDPSDPPSAA